MVLDKEKQGNILFPRRNMDFTEMFKKATLEEENREGVSPYPYQIRLAQGEGFPSFLEAPTEGL